MINIKPTIEVYDSEGNLSKVYNKAINKMIDQTFDIDLEQFDFDEIAKGKCKEFDDLVTKLCAKSGLGSDDIYSMLLERFIGEYDMDYDVNYVYGLDELEESKKSSRKSLKESQEYSFDYFYQLLKDDKHFSVNYAHDDLPDDDTVYANGDVDVKWFIDGKRLNHSAILSIPCFSMVFAYEGLLFNCEHGSRYNSVIGYADISDVRFTSDVLSLLLVNGLRITFNLY